MMLQAFWIFSPEQNLCIMQCLKCLNWIIGLSVRFITWRLSQNISQHNGKTLAVIVTSLLCCIHIYIYCCIMSQNKHFYIWLYYQSIIFSQMVSLLASSYVLSGVWCLPRQSQHCDNMTSQTHKLWLMARP